jgi:hypothetical protein
LLCLLFLGCNTEGDATVSLVVPRGLAANPHEWAYDTDQLRFVGTVVEPLCRR